MKYSALIISALVYSATLFASTPNVNDTERPQFNKKKDLLLAQFDSKPDPDDVHAQAALGSMMRHSDMKGVKVYAVSGATGEQKGLFLESSKLFNAIFGKRWTAANQDWDRAVEDIVDKVLPILKKGGKVWVQEAGQSNITADWIRVVAESLDAETIKNNVIVVQHSFWNEKKTDTTDLAYVREVARYFSIDNGNAEPTVDVGVRGPYITPSFRAKDAKWLALAKQASDKKVREYWTLADEVIDHYFPDGVHHKWSYLHYDGVDYSDCCENWWILNIGEKADSHEKFWNRYVIK